MDAAPFRSSVGDITLCLAHLREADRLLDSIPRTAAAERAEVASDRAAAAGVVAGGVLRQALVVHAAQNDPSIATPTAVRELGEAVELLQSAANELGDHAGAQTLRRATATWDRVDPEAAAKSIATVVRSLHPKLREEFGQHASPALTNWNETSAEDEAAIDAAGLSARSRAFKIALVAIPVVLFYALLLSR